MKHPITLLLSLLLLVAFTLPVAAEITSISSAINKAGRQRMLTQRMVKSYCMLGIDVQQDVAEEQLRKAIDLFELQLHELNAYTSGNGEIGAALARVEALWQPFKKTLQAPVSRENAQLLLETNDELLRAANKVVLKLQDTSGSSFGRLVNVSGRQRMLSQRLAKFYMLRAWQLDNAEIRSEMEQSRNEFKGALAELTNARENSPAINAKLAEAAKQWALFDHGLGLNGEKLVPLIAAMTSEKLLEQMNEITTMYEALSGEQVVGGR
ncbi:MAG: type IV pili methyl-accepting chemotaxis transducer N-terminal domain-containing protein [Gammaproteobacteria bacterium]|nr:type IV pili methyl-accepting chemotaxis transducer N-terminal domain-containing protein [Gammaproteobacteria bacterium]